MYHDFKGPRGLQGTHMDTLKPKKSKSITFAVREGFFTFWAILAHSAACLHGEIDGIQNGSQRTETEKFCTRLNTKNEQLERDNFRIKCNFKTVAFFLVLYLFYFSIQYVLLII